jgi:hypothetical protein
MGLAGMGADKIAKHVRHTLAHRTKKKLGRAIAALAAARPDDHAIHEARTAIKHVRALVAAVAHSSRRVSGAKAAQAALRRAGRQLAPLRDTAALAETVRIVRGRFSKTISHQAAEQLIHHLSANRSHANLARLRSLLTRIRARLPDIVRQVRGGSDFRHALARGYARSQSALPPDGEADSVAVFHRWRRRVKTHLYQMRLVAHRRRPAADRVRRLRQLQTWLGDDHNLAVLAAQLVARPSRFGSVGAIAPILGCIQVYQQQLRRRALRSGRGLFRITRRRFEALLEQWWRQNAPAR